MNSIIVYDQLEINKSLFNLHKPTASRLDTVLRLHSFLELSISYYYYYYYRTENR